MWRRAFSADVVSYESLMTLQRSVKVAETKAARTAAKKGVFNAPRSDGPRMAVRTPNMPGYSNHVDAAKYAAMRKVLLRVMPAKAPGITQSEMMAAVGRTARKNTFPKTTYMWWAKCVQLDLEARGELVRDPAAKPLRWHQASRLSLASRAGEG